MCGIDSHSNLVHALYNLQTEVTNAVIAPFRAPITDEVATVVSQERNALAERIKVVHVVRCPEMFRISHAENDADLARAFRRIDACRFIDPKQIGAVMGQKPIPGTDKLQRLL